MSLNKEGLRVFLDHLIEREGLLYRTGTAAKEDLPVEKQKVALTELQRPSSEEDDSFWEQLRKPDFQRPTYAWRPDTCVSLLESVISHQVVPSVILWVSPESYVYVLDGGHRISVLLAWIRDDWGDKNIGHLTPQEQEATKTAALEVRRLLASKRIRNFSEYKAAFRYSVKVERDQGRAQIKNMLSQSEQDMAEQWRQWKITLAGFPIQWVKGDYDVAERSFLRINKAGEKLSAWETKIVEHRKSSLARLIISIANPRYAKHCWPEVLADEHGVSLPDALNEKRNYIVEVCDEISQLLYQPSSSRATDMVRPLLTVPATKPDDKPAYTAEILTIIRNRKGQKADIESLLNADTSDETELIIDNGYNAGKEAKEAINHISGTTSISLGFSSLTYFYNDRGESVRALFYGMLYWLRYGSPSDIRSRKVALTCYRGRFEDFLVENKKSIVQRFSRRIGSGSEVTVAVARYFDGLLRAIVRYRGETSNPDFIVEHKSILENSASMKSKNGSGQSRTSTAVEKNEDVDETVTSSARNFPKGMRNEIAIGQILSSIPRCGICNGRIHIDNSFQVDHIQEVRNQGKTEIGNGRLTHNFCNNMRASIEELMSAPEKIEVPDFETPTNSQGQFELELDFDLTVGGEEISSCPLIPAEDDLFNDQ